MAEMLSVWWAKWAVYIMMDLVFMHFFDYPTALVLAFLMPIVVNAYIQYSKNHD